MLKFLLIFFIIFNSNIYGHTRLKDIAVIEGVRDNILIGYGLVVGLNGTGDNIHNSIFTQKGLTDFLEKLGVNIQNINMRTRNIAAVTVTANLPPFARQGSRIDVKVSALGDCRSLRGGTLLASSLVGADGNIYALAQGGVTISDFTPISDNVRSKSRHIETNGVVVNGAIIEDTIKFNFQNKEHINFILLDSDFTTANSVANIINKNFGNNIAKPIDSTTIKVNIPKNIELVKFISQLEQLEVNTDNKAKIIIEEATGTVIVGEGVKIKPVAISQGNLNIQILGNKSNIKINDGFDNVRGTEIHSLESLTTLSELVEGLNKLGVLPKDIITILYNMKNVGAIDAHLEVR